MRDLRKALAGFGAQSRKPRKLREVPAIRELELLLDAPGGAWAATFEERFNQLSLSLFGVTQADTNLADPHPDTFVGDERSERYIFSRTAMASYGAALAAWEDWQKVMLTFEREEREMGSERYWMRHGLDVTDGCGMPIRCLPYIERQMFAAVKRVLPGAKLSLDGSGKRASQSPEEWGAALAAEAARFRPSR